MPTPSKAKKPSKDIRSTKGRADPTMRRKRANAFRRLTDVLTKGHVRHVVIGAQAVSAYVATRETYDLDLLVAEGAARRVDGLAGTAFERLHGRRGGVFVFRDPGSGAEIHVREAIDKSDQEALDSTIRVRLFARDVRVPAPEYLVVMKLASMQGQRKHWEDIISLIKADCIDTRFVIAHLVREHPGLIGLFLELVTQATPMPRRKRS